MKKLRLILFKACDRNCECCCNKDFDIDSLPIERNFKDYDLIMLTGGEPMLNVLKVMFAIDSIRAQNNKANIYLYTADRALMANKLKTELSAVVGPRGIVIEETPLRSVKLPQGVIDAITLKAAAEQDAQKMEFVLQKERQEAERKRIEAQGIKDFQKIVSEGISDKLLAWKGIEATENIAKSENAKTVIIGSGKNGLPIILGQ